MPSLSDLLGNPLKDVMNSASAIIGKFVADPDKKIEAQTELYKLQSDLQSKLIDADSAWAKSQAEVLETEMKSDSWMGKNWRPILMLTFTFIMAFNYVLVPIFSIKSIEVPPDMWSLLKIGMGGYIIGRSAEKIVPSVTTAIVEAKKPSE